MVVVITSTGGVTKRLFTFSRPSTPGWPDLGGQLSQRAPASASGWGRGCSTSVCTTPSLSATEAEFLDGPRARCSPSSRSRLRPPCTWTGTARLLTTGRMGDVSELNLLMEMLERRVTLLEILRSALSAGHSVAVRIGTENEAPALRSLALVAAGYGLPQRTLAPCR